VLKRINLLKERVEDWQSHPFSVQTVASLAELDIQSRICFFTEKSPAPPVSLRRSFCFSDALYAGTRTTWKRSKEIRSTMCGDHYKVWIHLF
jgi:hypothetical protein